MLSRNLQRIVEERGQDFFERNKDGFLQTGVIKSGQPVNQDDTVSDDEGEGSGKMMTKDELYKLKMEVVPQL